MRGLHLRAVLLLAGCVAAAGAGLAGGAAAQHIELAQAGPAPRTVVFRDNTVRGETVATDAAGLTQILFADGTALTLGPNSEISIDSFVFAPAEGTATLAATLKRGVFRFIGGRTSKTPDGVALSTPFGTLGVASAGVDISLGTASEPPHFDLVFGGTVTLSNGATALARAHTPGYSIVPDGGSASVRKTPPEWRTALQEQLSWRATGVETLELAGASRRRAVEAPSRTRIVQTAGSPGSFLVRRPVDRSSGAAQRAS